MKKSKKKLGMIGHFGGNESFFDGQTVKTKIYNEELLKRGYEIQRVDTYYKKSKPLKLVLDTLKCLIGNKNILVLLSRNGMRFYFPLLYFASKYGGRRIYHVVTGGNLDVHVERYPKFRKYLSEFEVNWVQTESLRKKLNEKGILNSEVMPNFKRLNITKDIDKEYREPYRFCMFSRVMREKGIEEAIHAVEELNTQKGRRVCELDIYGQVDSRYAERFDEVMSCASDAVKYKGAVDYDKSAETLRDYYALLFPTFWEGEGFPGTVIDAFAAGIPVVATDWNCNSEVVHNGINGIVYPNSEIGDLLQAIECIISMRDGICEMKKNCIETAKRYTPDPYMKKILATIMEGRDTD